MDLHRGNFGLQFIHMFSSMILISFRRFWIQNIARIKLNSFTTNSLSTMVCIMSLPSWLITWSYTLEKVYSARLEHYGDDTESYLSQLSTQPFSKAFWRSSTTTPKIAWKSWANMRMVPFSTFSTSGRLWHWKTFWTLQLESRRRFKLKLITNISSTALSEFLFFLKLFSADLLFLFHQELCTFLQLAWWSSGSNGSRYSG